MAAWVDDDDMGVLNLPEWRVVCRSHG